MGWFTGFAIAATITVLAVGGVLWPLGHLLIEEFTRPGVTIEQGTPQWGDWAFPEAVEEPLKDSRRTVTFQAADGVLLCGEFWAQKCGAPTIIVSHGFHLPSRYFRSVAALEYAYGANVLLFDYRGHGESSLVPTTCGNAEVNDLLAAVEVAARQRETMRGKVYVHGFSMGAAVAFLLPAHPALAGIIADSPYCSAG
ncbi:MAG TPA: alpha/beta fold hydrolase [Ktedonobacteraceae bacterium]|nr:alpha/beta fold hydrolase [Ktedonobacteraceae bacterium]